MKARTEPMRGRPLLFLALLLSGWTMLRVATWENPWPAALVPDWTAPTAEQLFASSEIASPQDLPKIEAQASAASKSADLARVLEVVPARDETLPQARPAFAENRSLVGHNLLLMAAMSRLPMPSSVAALIDEPRPPVPAPVAARPDADDNAKRWHFDGWLLLREGGAARAVGGAGAPSYGASQAGGVLAYRLSSKAALRPEVYLRASSALREPRGGEVALGLRAAPLGSLPVRVHAEWRASEQEGDVQLRPAAFATLGFERRDLPLGMGARGYAQAGYVGGKQATGFIDAHLVVDREWAHFDLGRLRAGGGAWGGAQEGAARLDVGPSASLELPIADLPARLAVDYRIRVAGNAEPDSGAALTLSTGF